MNKKNVEKTMGTRAAGHLNTSVVFGNNSILASSQVISNKTTFPPRFIGNLFCSSFAEKSESFQVMSWRISQTKFHAGRF
jgi:hypothetical protein